MERRGLSGLLRGARETQQHRAASLYKENVTRLLRKKPRNLFRGGSQLLVLVQIQASLYFAVWTGHKRGGPENRCLLCGRTGAAPVYGVLQNTN